MVIKRRKSFGIIIFILVTMCLIICNVYAQGAKELYDKAKDYINKGMYDQAIVELTKAVQINPNFAEAYCLRGELYRNKSDLGRAIPDYSKAIQINPNYAEVYYYRAVSYYFTQEYDKAWQDVHKAENLGYKVFPSFIEDLKQASGRDK